MGSAFRQALITIWLSMRVQDLKIRRIHYWTEALPGDLFEIWARYREEALTGLAK